MSTKDIQHRINELIAENRSKDATNGDEDLIERLQSGKNKGSKNRERILDPYKEQIRDYLKMGLSLASIRKIVNNQLDQPISYNSYRYFVQHDEELKRFWAEQKAQ